MRQLYWIGFFILLSGVQMSCNRSSGLKIIVVDVEEVFERFQMQKEFRSEVDLFMQHNKGTLDSLSAEVNKLADHLDHQPNPPKDEVEQYKRLYSISAREQQKYDAEMEEMISKYDQMILKRIDTGMREFANREGIDLVVSKGGSYPGVLYSIELLNRTEDFIIYLNDSYDNVN